jgi:hypothetical protein
MGLGELHLARQDARLTGIQSYGGYMTCKTLEADSGIISLGKLVWNRSFLWAFWQSADPS